MFGYVRPSLGRLTEEERVRFQAAYCGLCRTMGHRCGAVSRLFLNYDLTFLAVLLSEGAACETACRRCIAHPFRPRRCVRGDAAFETAADMSVILTWWQLRDGVADHGFWRGLPYRLAALALRRGYRRARARQPDFDEGTRAQLAALSALERANCASLDRPADTFARLLAGAAQGACSQLRRRVLEQLLYHLGRWIYLVDAADDLKKDVKNGSYNPLVPRFGAQAGELSQEARRELGATLDGSIRRMAAASELEDFGVWRPVIESVVYEGLYAVGAAVLNGTFHTRRGRERNNPLRKAGSKDA